MRIRLLFLVGVTLLLCRCGYAQSWQETYENAKAAFERKEVEQAYALAQQALTEYRDEDGATNSSYAAILRLLSEVCYDQSKYEEGLGYVEKELIVLTSRDETLATACTNAALFYQELNRHTEAIGVLEKAKEILLEFYKPEESAIVSCELSLAINYYLNNENQKAFDLFSKHLTAEPNEDQLQAHFYYSRLLAEMGQSEKAIASFLRTRQKFDELGLGQTTEYASLLAALGYVYHQQNSYREAEELYERAETIFEKNAAVDTDEYARLVNQRIVNYFALGDEQRADELLKQIAAQPNGQQAYGQALALCASWHAVNNAVALAKKQASEAVEVLRASKTSSGGRSLYEALKVLAYIESVEQTSDAELRSEEALVLAQKLFQQNPVSLLAAQNSHTRNLLNLSARAEAIQSARTAMQLLKSQLTQPFAEAVGTLTLLGRAYQQQGNFLVADSAYAAALQLYELKTLTADQQYTFLLNNFALSQQEQGNWSRARELLLLVVGPLQQRTSRQFEEYAVALENLALLEMRLGQAARAKQYLDSALLVFDTDSKKQTATFGSFQLTLGKYYQAVADFAKAEVRLRSGQGILQQLAGKDTELFAQSQNALALLYQTLGNYTEAEPRLKDAIAIYASKGNNREVSTAKQNLATLYQIQEKFNEAEQLLTEALQLDERNLGKQHPQYAVTLQNLATLYQKKREFAKAAALLEQVRQTTQTTLGSEHPLYATITTNLAALYQDQGQYPMAEKYWNESVSTRKKLLGEEHPDYARSLFGLANFYFATGQFELAYQHFAPVIQNYQNQVARYFTAMSEKEKSALYARIKPVFDTYQDFCIQYLSNNGPRAPLTEQLYNLQLANKAILLNASNKLRNAVANSPDEEIKTLFKEWVSTKEQLVKFYSMTRQERQESQIDVAKTEEKANDLEKVLAAKSNLFNSLTSSPTVDWRQIQNQLNADEAAIEIMRIRKKFVPDSIYYVGLVVSPSFTEPRTFIWPKGMLMEQKLYKYFRNTIKHHVRDTLSYATYWSPVANAVPNIKKLWISCDGVFNKINPNTIYNPTTNTWILDEYTLYLINNTRELSEKKPVPANSSTKTATLFGYADFNLAAANQITQGGKRASGTRYGFDSEDIPMLPATEKEVVNISTLLKNNQWQTEAYMLDHANEQNLKKIQSPTILHVATHGFFLSDVELTDSQDDADQAYRQNPLFRSGILLAGAGVRVESNDEDGVLTAYEALNLNLDNTELVSLSACETGLGEVRNGEGVYGLQRSFLVAGAKAVLMSLWQVDDQATQELMDHFYQYWFEGETKADAFREAQLKLKEKYQHPYYWGAFVMIGN
jgi:CHAT domain-containing protein